MENFRSLIERAMLEAQAEFAAVLARKLDQLLGMTLEELERQPRPKAGAVKPPTRKAPSTASKPSAKLAKRFRSSPTDLAALQDKILHAMEAGRAMKKVEILRAARLGGADEIRVSNVLAKLREAGIVTMHGQKRLATYVLKSDAGE